MYMILQLFEERYQDDISMALTESGIEEFNNPFRRISGT